MNKRMIFNYPININENNPLYYVLYDFIGMQDGWIIFNYERYNERNSPYQKPYYYENNRPRTMDNFK